MATYIKSTCAECSSALPCGGCEWYCATQSWIANSGNLPSAVNFYGTSLSLSGTSYGNTTNGVILEGSVWAVYQAGVRTTQPSLYSANISDNFNSTYTLTIPNGGGNVPNATVTLTRNGCIWGGNQTIEGKFWQFTLINYSQCFQDDWGWEVMGIAPSLGPSGDLFFAYKLDDDGIPITQGTPTGSYNTSGAAVITIY